MKNFIIKVVLLLLSVYASAQQDITNNGNLHIHSGGSLTVFQHFNNHSSAALVNDGNVYIKGNISNRQSSMQVGSGVLHLNGSSAQSINGTQLFRTFDLITDNSAGIVLNNNVSVSGTHNFAAGLISGSATPNYLIYEDGSSYTGADDSKHATSWVTKKGNSDFIFPVGNASYLREIAISNISASSEFSACYDGLTSNTNNLTFPIKQVNIREDWILNASPGSSAQVTLNWDHSKVPFQNFAIADLRVAQFNGTTWVDGGGAASGNMLNGSVTSDVISNFGRLTVGSVSLVLPLHFLGVTAKRYPGFTTVEWRTTNEEHVNRHEIQRSLSGNNFVTIGQVVALNQKETQTYWYNDASEVTGTVYYRIKSIDWDGKMTYSSIVSVTIADAAASFRLLKNPVQERITLRASSAAAGTYNYQLLSGDGKLVQAGNVAYSGYGDIDIPVPGSLASGTYMLSFSNQSHRFITKVVVE